MTNTADALEILAIVAACHLRTAPRMDDPEAATATATVWAELFDRHDFTVQDLIAAVKKRAEFHSDAPEPADILRVAKATRADLSDRMDPDERAANRPEKPVVEEPVYPLEWTAEQRLTAYWARVNEIRDQHEHPEGMFTREPASAETRAAAVAAFAAHQAGPVDPVPFVNVLLVACDHCQVPVGEHCITGIPARRLSSIPAHPGRIIKAAIAAGHSPVDADRIAQSWERRQFRIYKNEAERDAKARK